jgi:tetratricopeptide (TPR) repeat protein
MKKCYGLIFLAFVLAGCGKRDHDPVDPFPTIERLLSDGWRLYSKGEYEAAVARFDSAIDMKADEMAAHIGAGWSRVHLGEFKNAHGNFALVITVGNDVSPTAIVWKEDSDVKEPWVIRPSHTPILGFPSQQVVSKARGAGIEILYDIESFDDSTITLVWSEKNEEYVAGDTVLAGGDTLVVPFPPESLDVLQVNYAYYSGGETAIQIDGYCGDVAAASANLEYLNAIMRGNAVIRMSSDYEFEHDSEITARGVRITLAQCYYNTKLFDNALREVLVLDPTWNHDPNSDTFLFDLLDKIIELLEE